MEAKFLSLDEKKNDELTDEELDNVSGGTISGAQVKPTVSLPRPTSGSGSTIDSAPAPSPSPTPTAPTGDSGGSTNPNTVTFPTTFRR